MNNEELLEDVLGELPEIIAQVDTVTQALRDAECVENLKDLRANLKEALTEARALVKALEEQAAR